MRSHWNFAVWNSKSIQNDIKTNLKCDEFNWIQFKISVGLVRYWHGINLKSCGISGTRTGHWPLATGHRHIGYWGVKRTTRGLGYSLLLEYFNTTWRTSRDVRQVVLKYTNSAISHSKVQCIYIHLRIHIESTFWIQHVDQILFV